MEPRRRTTHQWRQPRSQRAKEPCSQSGGMEGCPQDWAVLRGDPVPAVLGRARDADTLLWMIIIVSPAGTTNQAGNTEARTLCWPHSDRQQKDDCITDIGISAIDNKRLETCFQVTSGYLYHISVEIPKNSPFHCFITCLAFSYAVPALNYLRAG